MSHAQYDLVVIGSGLAGQKAALNGAKLGRKAVLMRVKSGAETRFVPVQLKKS